MHLDPNKETLATLRVLQKEKMWVAQLQQSKDVVVQYQAVRGIAGRAPTKTSIEALRTCVQNSNIYTRYFLRMNPLTTYP